MFRVGVSARPHPQPGKRVTRGGGVGDGVDVLDLPE